MNFDQIIARHLRREDESTQAAARRVLAKLNGPLPRQRHSWLDHLPSLLLTRDFAPAWPRVAALACVMAFGCMVGFAAPGLSVQKSAAATIKIADLDAGSLGFDAEPITGARP
jgi:hypothetical protein